MLLLLEGLDLGCGILLVDTPLAAIPVDISHLVDADGVPLVERYHVELSHGGSSLGGGRVLDESESVRRVSVSSMLSMKRWGYPVD